MRQSEKRKMAFRTTCVVIATIIIAGLATWFDYYAAQAVINSTIREMEEIGVQLEIVLEETLEETQSDIAILAEHIVQSNITKDNVVEYFSMQSHVAEFTSLYYIDLEGNGISADNQQQNFSNHPLFLQALENKLYIAEPLVFFETGEIVFDIFAPVVKDGEVTAVLYSTALLDNFMEVVAQATKGTGDMFIVDKQFNLIFSTSNNHIGHSTIPEREVAEIGIENLETALNHIISEQNGGFYYDYFGVPKVMVYMPIATTEWAFAINVEAEAINSELADAVDLLNALTVAIFWALLAVICYTSFHHVRSLKQLRKTAYYDALTQLPNKAKLKEDMRAALERNTTQKYCIIIFDIENFKAINEMFGHDVGDSALKEVKAFIDTLDTPNIIVARVGDDKFAIFAENDFLMNVEALMDKLATHYRHAIAELANYSAVFNVGRYSIEQSYTDVDDIINRASLALVRAKQSKGELVCDYDDAFRKALLTEAEITNKMKAALENKEFKVYLQPKFSINEHKLVGAEALVRWVEADGSMIMPVDFIPLFERNGFIVELDRYILEHVCAIIKHWADQGYGPLVVSVNCSRLNLENPLFVDSIVAVAASYNVPYECIEIELTESTTIENENTIEQLFAKLHSIGFKISIDDFGAGYSSLGMLKNLQADTLKMDRSFFIAGKNIRRDDMLIDSIIKMAHNLGMYVVAEGIETNEQLEMLKSMNCDAVQGFIHAKPMPVAEFEAKYSAIMAAAGTQSSDLDMPLIRNINDAKFATSFAPCGLLTAKLDAHFTILEANQGYFNIIGFTREEVRDTFNNRGFALLHPEDRKPAAAYFASEMQLNPNTQLDFVCRLITKAGSYKTAQISGNVAESENGEHRLYFSVTDISNFVQANNELQKERDFNARISALTDNVFFEFELESKTIRYSKNFAERFNIPVIIENFTTSQIYQELFAANTAFLGDVGSTTATQPAWDGEICLSLPSGEPAWFLYNCKAFYDESGNRFKTVGKLTEVFGDQAEMDILKAKSEANPDMGIYNQQATERYIRNYLKLAKIGGNNSGAFFAIKLNGFTQLNESFGEAYGIECLNNMGLVLRNIFRTSDIIGRLDSDTFFVFVGDYKTLEFVEKRASELCDTLKITYTKDGVSMHVSASIGISLYPEHGKNYNTLCEKASTALAQINDKSQSSYTIFG